MLHELLDRFVICGEKHLRYLLAEFDVHYHSERPHQGLDNMPPSAVAEEDLPSVLAIPCNGKECHERLGRLLKRYTSRVA